MAHDLLYETSSSSEGEIPHSRNLQHNFDNDFLIALLFFLALHTRFFRFFYSIDICLNKFKRSVVYMYILGWCTGSALLNNSINYL